MKRNSALLLPWQMTHEALIGRLLWIAMILQGRKNRGPAAGRRRVMMGRGKNILFQGKKGRCNDKSVVKENFVQKRALYFFTVSLNWCLYIPIFQKQSDSTLFLKGASTLTFRKERNGIEYIFIILQWETFSVPAAAYRAETKKKKMSNNKQNTRLKN